MKIRSLLCVVTVLAGALIEQGAAMTIELGKMAINAHTNLMLVVTNHSQTTWVITNVATSCECLLVQKQPARIKAGKTGTLVLSLQAKEPGLFGYEMRLQTDQLQAAPISYVLNVQVDGAKRPRNWSLYKTLDELGPDWDSRHAFTYVDVRAENEYANLHIRDALNIPLFAVKTKSFLMEQNVVLVDAGWGNDALENEVQKLRTMGFHSVSILYGGMAAWQQQGGALERVGEGNVNHLPPIALRQVDSAEDWMVVDVAGTGADKVMACEQVPFNAKKPVKFAETMNKMLKGKPAVKSIVIVSERGTDYEALATSVDSINALVFFLEGGWSAWEANQQLMSGIQNRRYILAQAVTGTGTAMARSGCGGCKK